MLGRIRNEHSIATVAGVIDEPAIDEPGGRKGIAQASIPKAKRITTRLMALGTVGRQIRTDTPFPTPRFIRGGDERRQQIQIGQRTSKITSVEQGTDLIGDSRFLLDVSIELRSGEAESKTSRAVMASQAFAAT